MTVKSRFFLLVFCLCLARGTASEGLDFEGGNPPPGIPRVLLIGDATTLEYAPITRAHLDGLAEVQCIPEDGKSTKDALLHLDNWLGKQQWDVIHFNFGLWDASTTPSDGNRVPLDQYERNLERLVTRLKATGATLLWATTVSADHPNTRPAEIASYNAVAAKVMESNGVRIDDLGRVILPPNQSVASNQLTLTREVVRLRGEHVASEIQTTLVFGPIMDDPKLPSVLLIGDSISIGYTLPLRSLLAGKANVHRIPDNGQSTEYALRNLKSWLGERKWDVIHFNWGIWDAHIFVNGSYRVSQTQYRQNLTQLTGQLKATGARLIWASTTPLQPRERTNEFWVKAVDIPAYNAVAKKVMESQGIAIDDLYSAALPQLVPLQQADGVHFTDKGSWLLANQVAEEIQAELVSINDAPHMISKRP